ncbi:MAG: hypothetical protein HYU58_16290 [Proteobacteria bacterium]|nr:hypothetical protein [Pseudomonadota bacterium]
MAVVFQSSMRRNLFMASVISFAFDVAIIFVVAKSVFDEPNPFTLAITVAVAAHLAVMLYTLYSVLKRWLWFFMFEREDRIKTILVEFERLKMPAPESQYADAEEYLTQAALNDDIPARSRLAAGTLLGYLGGSKLFDRMLAAIVLEAAIKRYLPHRYGTE